MESSTTTMEVGRQTIRSRDWSKIDETTQRDSYSTAGSRNSHWSQSGGSIAPITGGLWRHSGQRDE